MDYVPIVLSLEAAGMASFFLIVFGILVAKFMSEVDFYGKDVIEGFLILPLVVPPVVVGFILLVLLGKYGPIGIFLERFFNTSIIFTIYAASIASFLVAFPLMYKSARSAFEGVDENLKDAAKTLGAGNWKIFFTITLPLSLPGLVSGFILAFARALGEFGATIMVAGDIPGKTNTIPIQIFFATENGDIKGASVYVLIICIINLFLILLSNKWSKSKLLYKSDGNK
ncbi:molybdate ABC transporter, inner membrane subunit [Thermodesulfobium narugense DSM 14796]|uniref:Molybdenum transport system permease n=1 Tax=Thermodesulfobium narugense DSM 14796 TaxID=747365 RepID=M1E8Y1_9BACT|nr:molybdate ABC transporter permease subunit [Thermodesulfobium narugense]AEE15453.1 molybdate ABC transporter, inner membrane subunit [Thermodesulfobium narugense DSM 14796]